jgi:hypothetical protein
MIFLRRGIMITRPDLMRGRYGRRWLVLHSVDSLPISWCALAGEESWLYILLAATRLGRLL